MAEHGWNTIESDAGVFTELVEGLGVKGIQFEELHSVTEAGDVDYLRSLAPVYGAILLFKYPKKQPENRDGTLDEAASYNLFFANQVIQNACATQAILSILLNRTGLDPSDKSHTAGGENPDPVDADVNIGDMLIAFKEFAKEFPPEDRGLALSNSVEIRTVHNSFSYSSPFADEGNKPSSGEGDAYHFIAYTPLNGQLYELDGLQPAPISHGPCTKDDFADKLLPVVTRRMRSDPDGGISFVLLAMVKDPRIMAQKIGDEETIRRENAKRKAWKWENDLRQHNFMGFIHEALKEVITTKVKAGEYDKWIQDAKDKNEERREERRMAREDKMEF